MNGAYDVFATVAHALKTIRLNELFPARTAEKALFFPHFSFSCAVLDNRW
jgi:hypothetical protein